MVGGKISLADRAGAVGNDGSNRAGGGGSSEGDAVAIPVATPSALACLCFFEGKFLERQVTVEH